MDKIEDKLIPYDDEEVNTAPGIDLDDILVDADVLDARKDGAWVRNLPGFNGLALYVKGFIRNTKAMNDVRNKTEKISKAQKGKISLEQQMRVTCEALADHVLLDWSGLTQGGKELPYSKELATKILTSPAGERFAELVIKAAQVIDDGEVEFIENISKK